MKLLCLGSGSSGNTYILQNKDEALIIEAGISFDREVKKALDFNIRKIVGVVASHIHKDHSKYVAEYRKAGISVFDPYDESKACPLKTTYGNFTIRGFRLVHDVTCMGFYITHPDMGILVYASDTEYIKYTFKGVNHFLVEANYSTELVERDSAKYEHQITGHMSIDTTCKFLEVNKNPMLRNVILCHLSNENADREDFINQAEKVVDCPVYVAEKGLQVNMDLVPF